MRSSTTKKPESDFASSAMVRVLLQGMLDLGLLDTAEKPVLNAASAAVGLEDKRDLLTLAVKKGGLGCLALLGRGVRRYKGEPTHRALASARDAADLFVRWVKLEKYVHSRHRVITHEMGTNHAVLQHVSLLAGTKPLPAEDLVVLGALAALLEAIGLEKVQCNAGGAIVYPVHDPVALEQAVRSVTTDEWYFTWSQTSKYEVTTRQMQQPQDMAEAESWPETVKAAFHSLANSLIAPPTVGELAGDLGMSARSFQRQLQRVGWSHTRLLGEARYRSAGWWLLHTPTPIAETGFLCGYSDQSHFTRDFRRRSALTPAAYRAEFCA